MGLLHFHTASNPNKFAHKLVLFPSTRTPSNRLCLTTQQRFFVLCMVLTRLLYVLYST